MVLSGQQVIWYNVPAHFYIGVSPFYPTGLEHFTYDGSHDNMPFKFLAA